MRLLKLIAFALCLLPLSADAGRRGGLPIALPFMFGIWVDNTTGTAPNLIVEDQLHEISHVHVSPDGTKIAWTRWNVYDPTVGFYTENQSTNYGETFVANINGTGAVSLGRFSYNHGNSAWAPDGSGLYFNSTNNPCTTKGGINFYNLSSRITTTILYDAACTFAYGDPTVTGTGAGTTLVVGGADTTVTNAQSFLFTYTLAGHVLTQLNTPSIPSFPQSGPGPGDYDPKFNHAGTYVATNRHVGANCYHVVVTKLSDGTWTDLTDAGQACPTPAGTLSINANPEFNIADDTIIFWHADTTPANKGIWTIPFAGGSPTHLPIALTIPSQGLLKMPTWDTQTASTIYYSSYNIPVVSIPPSPVNTVVPALSGTFTVGQTLTASTGTWNNCSSCTYTYLFYREGFFQGARSGTNTYVLTSADLGARMSVDVVATNTGGVSSPALSLVSGTVIGSTVCYVSFTDGLDTNDCTTSTPGAPHGPIKTLGAVNAKTFTAGTSVPFKRGDTWDRAAGVGVSTLINPAASGAAGNPIVYDAYGSGDNPVLDGSITGFPTNSAADWTNVSGNVWQSAATFKPSSTFTTVTFSGTAGTPLIVTWTTQTPANGVAVIFSSTGTLPAVLNSTTTYYVVGQSGTTFNVALTPGGTAINRSGSLGSGTQNGGSNGRPFWDSTDVGNILWGCSAIGGTAPSTAKTCSFGKMTGGGTGGVWYKGGDGAANIGTTQGNWNFNTDNWRVQIYSVGNPFSTMSGLRLAIDGGLFRLNGKSHIVIQNLTIQNTATASAFPLQGTFSDITLRDNVIQWIGGGNNGGKSDVNARIGDAVNPEGTYTNILMERNWVYQIYDNCWSPQLFTAGTHDTQTVRNNIFYHFDKGFDLEPTSLASSTINGMNFYNNTIYAIDSWSMNQRPNGGAGQWGFESFDGGSLVMSHLNMENNIFAGIILHGILVHDPILIDLAKFSPVVVNYNTWRLNSGTGIDIAHAGGTGGNTPMTTWSTTYGFETNGLIDIDPLFTSTSDLTPQVTSPSRNAGTNLYSSGVVWDFFRKPRPAAGNVTMGAIQ